MIEEILLDARSGWIEMVDDLGPTVFVQTLDVPGLRDRLERRGVAIVDHPSDASALIIDESSLALIESVDSSVTIVCLATNRWSPLHWVDSGFGGHPVRLTALRRRLEVGGRTTRAFGVLRSTTSPLALVSFDAPASAALVRSALAIHIAGHRRRLLDAAPRLGPLASSIYPGWLVIAHGAGRDRGFDPTGQVGYEQSVGFTRVLGEPPKIIEREAALADLVSEARVLDELASSEMAAMVPRVISAPDRHRQCPGGRAPSLLTAVMPGSPLPLRSMTDLELEKWTRRAANLLERLHAASIDERGNVLVHGDFWLGNLLVDGERIVGVIDWEGAHRGDPQIDRAFLGRSLTRYLQRDRAFTRRMQAAAHGVQGG